MVRSIWFRYLVSSVVVLMLPLLALAMWINEQYLWMLHQEITGAVSSSLAHTVDLIEVQLEGITDVALQLSFDNRLSKKTLQSSMLTYQDAIGTLDQAMSSNALIKKILYYPYGTDYLLSTSSSYTPNTFGRAFKRTDVDVGELLMDERARDMLVLPAQPMTIDYRAEANRTIAMLRTLPVGVRHARANALLLLDGEALEHMLLSYIPKGARYALLDAHNAPLLHNIPDPAMLPWLIGASPGAGQFRTDDYLLLGESLNANGWRIQMAIPTTVTMRSVHTIRQGMMGAILLVLVLGMGSTLFLTYFNYRPIRALIARQTGSKQRLGRYDEIAYINKAWSSAVERAQSLERHLLQSRDAVKQYLLFELLKGHFEDMTTFNAMGEELGITLQNPFLTAVVIMAPDGADQKLCAQRVEQMADEALECLCAGAVEERLILCVFAFAQDDMRDIRNCMDEVRFRLFQLYGDNFCLGVGDVEERAALLSRSTIQAMTALDYRLIQGPGRTIFFADLAYQNEELDIAVDLNEDIRNLLDAAKNGCTEQFEQHLGRLIQRIREEFAPLPLIRSSCNELVARLLALAKRMPGALTEQPQIESNVDKYQSLDKLASEILRLGQWICMQAAQQDQKKRLNVEHILEYLHRNYTDPTLCLQSIAQAFDATEPAIRYSFKREMQMSVWQYVTGLRINKAKKLLMDESLSVQQIVTQVGYYDASSFTRKFREQTGTTPGRYRAQLPDQANSDRVDRQSPNE